VSVPVLPRREKGLTGHPARAAPKQDEAEQNQARNCRGLCWFGNDGEGNGVQVVNRRQRGDDVTRAKTKVGDDQTYAGLLVDPVVATIERVEIAVVGHRSKVVKIRCGTVGWVDRVNLAIAIDKEEVIVCIKSQPQSPSTQIAITEQGCQACDRVNDCETVHARFNPAVQLTA